MRTVPNAFLAVLVIFLTGCGSIASRWKGDRTPYAGVKLSAETVRHYGTEGELIAALDIPISAIVDTFLLPYDLSGEKEPRDETVPAEDEPPAPSDEVR